MVVSRFSSFLWFDGEHALELTIQADYQNKKRKRKGAEEKKDSKQLRVDCLRFCLNKWWPHDLIDGRQVRYRKWVTWN